MNRKVKNKCKIVHWCLLLIVIFAFQESVAKATDRNIQDLITESVQGIKKLSGSNRKYVLADGKVFEVGNSVCDWAAVAMAVSGEKEAYENYLERMETYVERSYRENNGLDLVKATPYHTSVLTIVALGGNPLAFGTDADGNSIDLLADGTYDFQGESLGTQGLTGYIYALIALDANAYEIPKTARYNREQICNAIIESQSENGGLSIDGKGEDVDVTAMALQALAPYKEQNAVNEAITKAVNWLEKQMTPYGTFCCGSVETCESTAQVLMALCALDLERDDRFEKDGITPWEGLQEFRLEDGTYVHTLEETEGNLIATEQAVLALEAVMLRETKDKWLLNFEGYKMPEEQKVKEEVSWYRLVAVVLIMGSIAVGIIKHKKEKREYV